MNTYQNGKVYLITDLNYNKTYYGSTCESLSQRMARHRKNTKGTCKESMEKSSL